MPARWTNPPQPPPQFYLHRPCRPRCCCSASQPLLPSPPTTPIKPRPQQRPQSPPGSGRSPAGPGAHAYSEDRGVMPAFRGQPAVGSRLREWKQVLVEIPQRGAVRQCHLQQREGGLAAQVPSPPSVPPRSPPPGPPCPHPSSNSPMAPPAVQGDISTVQAPKGDVGRVPTAAGSRNALWGLPHPVHAYKEAARVRTLVALQ